MIDVLMIGVLRARGGGREPLWVAIGIALYAIGRWLQARYYGRYTQRDT